MPLVICSLCRTLGSELKSWQYQHQDSRVEVTKATAGLGNITGHVEKQDLGLKQQ